MEAATRTVRLGTGMGAILLAISLAGCAADNSSSGGPPTPGGERLAAKAYPDVADVPVPIGFESDEPQSIKYQIRGQQGRPEVRFVSQYYKGRKGKDAVAGFYWDSMEACKWRRDGVWKTHGVWRLHFSKGNERADINITENIWGTTTIYVELYPVSVATPASPISG
jgi:hypothetical protein